MLRLSGFALIAVTSVVQCPILAWARDETPNVVIQWNNAALQGVRDSKLGPPMVARALAIVHTCIYDAWAAYDRHALGTQLGGSLRQPPSQRRIFNKNEAISFAAYRAAVDLFPGDKATVFDPLMASLGYDPNDSSTNTETPSGVGNMACAAVINFRHNDLDDLEKVAINSMKSAFIPYNRRIQLIYDVIKPGYAKARASLERAAMRVTYS